MAQIFISYATEDRPRVQPLVELLEAEGLTVWWDRRIETGSSWDKVIEHELDAAACVVVVWSAHSVSADWVRHEATEAAERGVLVPIQIDEARLPLAFRRTQTAMLIGWPAPEARSHIRELIGTISQLVGVRPAEAGAKADVAPVSQIVIAVMPLSDRTPEANMAYLCEGMAEDLMNAFFPVAGLRVLSSMDTFALKHTRMTSREIGTALGATVVLEGNVQRAGQQVAVAARLVEVATGHTIYSQRFVRDIGDIFTLQAELADKVVEGLRKHLGLTGQAHPVLDSARRDQAAYELYANATTLPDEADARVGFRELYQMAWFECVIALDPKFSRAYVDLALLYWYGPVEGAGSRAKVRRLLEQLEAHSPGSPAAWAIQVLMEGDMAALERRCREAIAGGHRVYAYPHPTGFHDARAGYAVALAHAGLPREALGYFALIDRNGEPDGMTNWLHQGGCLVALGDYEAAIALVGKHRAMVPGESLDDLWQTIARIALGDLQGLEQFHSQLDSAANAYIAPVMRWKRGERSHLDGTQLLGDINDEYRASALLTMGEVQAGLDALEHVVRAWPAHSRHWLALRLQIFQRLFNDEVKQHPRYRKLLTELHLDDESRLRMREQVASLTTTTGVKIAPLLVL